MKLVFATHNPYKLQEIKALMPTYIELLSLADIGCTEDIAETETTIEGNALLKARYVRKHYDYPCFADDTGLEVEALNGEPGVYSARYAGNEKNDQANIDKLLAKLNGIDHREAQFKTVFALSIGTQEKTFTGICKGEIITEQKGNKGFGYDPVFQPIGTTQTFAEMPPTEKNNISHRGKAVQQLIAYFEDKSIFKRNSNG